MAEFILTLFLGLGWLMLMRIVVTLSSKRPISLAKGLFGQACLVIVGLLVARLLLTFVIEDEVKPMSLIAIGVPFVIVFGPMIVAALRKRMELGSG